MTSTPRGARFRTLPSAECTRRQGGFTLLELLVVMVIIGLLAAYVAPRYFSQVGRSEVRSAQAQIAALRNALDAYRLDVGSYPTTEQGLTALTAKPQAAVRWNGPYLQRAVPADPWGRPYQYKSPGEHGEYDLLSLGKDGQPGGTAEAADITSWQ
jgi:general secretion pathway protein G